jgi:biopolymer transport protein TolR
MAFSGAGGGASKAEMNVTPLIDVLLVIIIIFMVAVSLQKEKGVTADIPQPGPEQTTPQPRTVVVQIFEGGPGERAAVKINEETVSWDALPDRLREIFIRRNEKVAFVKGDKELDFQVVAEVVDIAHNCGADRVGLITKGMDL